MATHIDLIALSGTPENYQLLDVVAKRISRETGWEISLGRYAAFATDPDKKYHLTAKVPYAGHKEFRRYLRGLAIDYKKVLSPFFK